ncbi:hypothetical protein TeGR_g10991, partial [Tetraparma gracilis]
GTFLDISHRDADWLRERFPGIDAHLTARDLDFTKSPLPCVPAAHYTCGGVDTDLQGKTSLRGLFAAGEAARTGLHGGNRLASTSLLEGLVWGNSVAEFIASEGETYEPPSSVSFSTAPSAPSPKVVAEATEELTRLKALMWDNVGIVRTPALLEDAIDALAVAQTKAEALYAECVCEETIMLRDASTAGLAVAQAALANRQSQGTHYIELVEEQAEAV